jgi:hypothetical protein
MSLVGLDPSSIITRPDKKIGLFSSGLLGE